MADGSIVIDTKIDSSGAEKGIGKLNSIAKAGAKGFGIAVAGVATAVGGLSIAAIKVGMGFEEGMSKVQAISGATGEEIKLLTDKAKEMGAKTKFSAGESAQAFQYMAMAGWKTGDMLNGIDGIMNLAAASGEDLALVSDIVTDALTAFGMSAKDSAQFADLLASAASNSNTNVSMLGESFKYVAPVAGALGHSAKDTAFALGLMANAGIKGSQSGTALRASLTNLAHPSKQMAEEMDRLGISLVDSNGKVKEGKALYDELRQKFSGLTDAQKTQSAATIFGKEAMSGMLSIINASEGDYNNLYNSLTNSAGAAENMAKTMQNNLAGSIEQLGGGLETLGLTAYDKFKEPMKDAIDTATEAVDSLVDSLSNGQLGESVDKIAVSFGKLIEKLSESVTNWLPKIIDALAWIMDNASFIASGIAGIGTALMVLNVANMIMGLVEAFKAFKAANEGATVAQWLLNAAMAANPIGLVVSIIAGLIAGIIVLWNTNEDFRNAVIDAWNAILGAAQTVWGGIVNFFTVDIPAAWQSLLDFFNGVPGWFADLWTTIQQAFVDGWNAIVNFFTQTIPQWIDSVGEWFNELPHLIGYALGYALGTIVKWGVDTWNYLVTNVPIWINNVVNFFATLPGRIWTWLVNTINRIVNWGQQTYTNMVNAATRAINATIQWFGQLPGRIWTWLVNTISRVAEFAVNLASRAREAGANMVTNLVEAVRNLPSRFAEIGRNIVQGVWNGITGMAGWIRDRVNGFFSGIVDGAKDALGIHSPSRVFRDQVGKYMAQGVGVGFENETENIKRSMKKNLSSLTAKMQATVDLETSKTSKAMTSGSRTINNTKAITNNDNGVTQINNFNQPVKSPSETARALKRVGRDLALGY
ncbi:phage tail tape measure protein [Clostridium botulinum]|uniref:Phage protein n=1 Tax=Clostridium botulinum (strain Okra / Type B1) TaxID=498213 RepID=B1IG91_CLOBK|nr:phage tail tape measure protein [Clostridium botulinum]ACA44334.1 phage protein [Clostridium botulinum B1 str. Okra]MBD5564515.1 phage tail tape measure protein [Clostridium botulinum]MBD5566568.1 phage tail tape measure protein [Clostridium botulinum]MBD5568916.1 phage tail tape measure protein [Clostridium botulinum]MBD5572818.1 phage tail tape measure protein [Clostridium botulinum]